MRSVCVYESERDALGLGRRGSGTLSVAVCSGVSRWNGAKPTSARFLSRQLLTSSDTESRKLCKKMKVDLSPKDKKVELFHYQDGAFHTEYNRAVTFKSIVAFLKDPKGPPLWEEDPGAKDVVHIDSEKDFRRLLKKEEKPLLMMFYAPWCSMCKRIMPHFQKAATQLRGHVVLAGMNIYPSEFENIKEEYNVRGYPTICYFEKGRFLFQYENYGSSAEDIVEWLKNPQPPQPQVPETPWADEGGSVYHLTDEDFDQFLKEHSSVLVMFHAPYVETDTQRSDTLFPVL
uniref:Protein disulfide isomerase family A member 5 n=1 Tax=Myotis myotis TaxID=51298 RepID=A0A7J8A0E5_MYOMY|nr:protein disulfide isomerase family A member 5 [Myotis myotis]